jgi:phosphoribosylanthranilate isomerase
MAVLIKICGLNTPAAVDAALDAGADFVGFVFFAPSPRHVGFEAARTFAARVGSRARKVAVTVDAPDDLLAGAIAALEPDLLQLHGRETPERVGVVRSRFRLPVMKAIPIARRADLSPVRQYEPMVDRLMFDARAPAKATRPGGHGVAFDWKILRNLDLAVPFMLSGGLDVGNVADALRVARPGGVDVSSGVESAPGRKDPDKIRAFVQAARAAAAELELADAGSSRLRARRAHERQS